MIQLKSLGAFRRRAMITDYRRSDLETLASGRIDSRRVPADFCREKWAVRGVDGALIAAGSGKGRGAFRARSLQRISDGCSSEMLDTIFPRLQNLTAHVAVTRNGQLVGLMTMDNIGSHTHSSALKLPKEIVAVEFKTRSRMH